MLLTNDAVLMPQLTNRDAPFRYSVITTENERVFFMCHSNYLEVSRFALRQNAAAVCETVGVPVIGVVKCSGYGVTINEAAAAWRAAGVTMFGVSRPEEALELRRCGFREDILLLSPVADSQTLAEMVENNVTLTVSGYENANFYAESAAQKPIRVHIAVDSGMGRFGVHWTDAEQAKAIYGLSGLSFEGIFSHFSSSFEGKYSNTRLQLERFLCMTQKLKHGGYQLGMRHIANSCAALRFPETRLDAVRIGSALVGRLPAPAPVKLERVGIFKAQIVANKSFQPGDTTGYGNYCKLKKRANAVVVSLGREDGFGFNPKPDKLRMRDFIVYLYHLLRDWVRPPCVYYKGQRLAVLGRIGNQYTLFETTDVEIEPGEWVEWDGNLMLNCCERRFV